MLGVFLLAGRLLPGTQPRTMAKFFIPVWLVLAVINLWIGVWQAGYSVREEAPVLLVVFAVPAVAALLIVWRT